MSRFRLTDHAQNDMREIWDEIGIVNANPHAADRLMEKFESQLHLLSSQPRIGQKRDEWSPGLRIFPAGNYVILYYPDDDGIEVVGIVYGRQDLPSLFDKGCRRFDT